ncbi:MAG: hypothetical protein JNM06_22435 [Blastocatellia bacterium]|nr:hypothetical protein [Blastocatellia bacterium]
MEKAWWTTNLPFRKIDVTYQRIAYEEIPPIKAKLDEKFKWLEKKPRNDYKISDETFNTTRLFQIEAQTNVKLPESFTTFVKNQELHYRIQSCTDCYFTLPNYAEKTIGKYEGFLITFLSNGSPFWNLYFDKTGEHFIVASQSYCGFDSQDEMYNKGLYDLSTPTGIDLEQKDICFCAPSFKEFIYRFWIENDIFYRFWIENDIFYRGINSKEHKQYVADCLEIQNKLFGKVNG